MATTSQELKPECARSVDIPSELQGKSLTPSLAASEVAEGSSDARLAQTRPSVDLPALDAFASDIHAYIREYIALADQKATFWFAIFAGVLGYLHSNGATSRWVVNPCTWGMLDALAGLAVTLLLVGAVLALFVVAPRLGGVQGIIFWRSIARIASPGTYAENVMDVSASGLTREKLEHCHILATVCSRKYAFLTSSIWLGFAGLALTLLYVALA